MLLFRIPMRMRGKSSGQESGGIIPSSEEGT